MQIQHSAAKFARFQGDVIQVLEGDDGTLFVVPSDICDTFGLNWPTQFRKLQGSTWATIVKMTTVAKDGCRRQVVAIPLKIVPMWMAGISVNKVKASLRVKLLAYQLEVVEVLSGWFFGVSDIPGLAAAFDKVKADLVKAESARIQAVKTARKYQQKYDALLSPGTATDHEFMSLREFCDRFKIGSILGHRMSRTVISRISRQLRKLSEAKGIPVERQGHPLFGAVNSYRTDILFAWLITTDVFSSMSVRDFIALTEGRLVL